MIGIEIYIYLFCFGLTMTTATEIQRAKETLSYLVKSCKCYVSFSVSLSYLVKTLIFVMYSV